MTITKYYVCTIEEKSGKLVEIVSEDFNTYKEADIFSDKYIEINRNFLISHNLLIAIRSKQKEIKNG